MQPKQISFQLRVFENEKELNEADQLLMKSAKEALQFSYSPYSHFKVGASILLENGAIVSGSNQENASYPVCVCAEVSALNAASSLHPNIPMKKMAITVKSPRQLISKPAAPCGQCRQTILEYENRFQQNIEILLMGEEGEVYAVDSVKDLLPLHFSGVDL
jgi:cytidine deaminase